MIRLFASTLALLLAMVAFVAWNPLQPPTEADGVRTLQEAQFVMSESPVPPADGWQTVVLPDNWRERQPHASGLSWYRIRFTLPALPTEPQALYLPRLAALGELWLNDALLTPRAEFATAQHRGRQTVDAPVYLILPASAFRNGSNELLVRLQGDAAIRSGLAAVRLGPVALIEPVWQRQNLLYTVLPYALMILLGAAMCLAYAYAYARQRRQYTLILIALGVGGLTVLIDMIPILPLSLGERHAVRALFFTLLMWMLCRVGYRLSNRQPEVLLRILDGLWVLVSVSILGSMAMGVASDRVWGLDLPFVVALTLVGAMVLETAWQQRSVRLLLLALAGLFWCTAALQSLVTPLGWLPWESFRYRSAGAIPLCIMLLLFFGERFVLDREEALRNQHNAIATERSRILQDMHDGMGAQLITAKRLALRPEVDRHDVALVIDESLQDLRLIIDSLDVHEGDLLPLLGNLRFRLEPRLASLGIKLSWEAQPLPALASLSPASALAILRIVQESINNALRHAQPDHIRLVVTPEASEVVIQVIDNGVGFSQPEIALGGRGLTGMRSRAERLAATLQVDSTPGLGTTVALHVPHQLPI